MKHCEEKESYKQWLRHTRNSSAVLYHWIFSGSNEWLKCLLWVERPSRWWRSKTWRSPSSTQIHQKYIYMWNNFYRTPTELWEKTLGFPKRKKLPTYLGRAKEKRKKQRQKNRDGTCTSGRELWRRKSFHTWGSPFTGTDWRQGVSFRAMEESKATGVQRAKQRDSCTEDWCRLALTSLRGLSAHALGWVGDGSWGSSFGVRSQGEDWGWLCEHSLKGANALQLAGRDSGKNSGPA